MRAESWFDELTKSLSDGLFADAVILALARTERSRRVDDSDQAVMREVAGFLANVLQGYGWFDNPKVNEETATNASFFRQAVRASVAIRATSAFLQHIEQLKETADELAACRITDESRLSDLRTFFRNHNLSEMERTEDLFDERVGLERATWMTAREYSV